MCLWQVWRIENLELAEVKPRTYGQFYGGDCYLVLYKYQRSNQDQYILYMWQVSIITNKYIFSLYKVLFKLKAISLSLNSLFCIWLIYTRAVMPLKMKSQHVPTRLSMLIISTMELQSWSEWSWERSLAIFWPFSKAK